MMYLGDYEDREDVFFSFALVYTGGTIRVHMDAVTGSQDTAGLTISADDPVAGITQVTIDTDRSFYLQEHDYTVLLEGATVGGDPVSYVLAHFSIENRWPNNDTILANTNVIKNILEGDEAIDTTVTPWAVVITNKISDAELVRKSLKDTAGANITSTATVIGQKVEPA